VKDYEIMLTNVLHKCKDKKFEILTTLKKGGTKGACVKAYSSDKRRVYYGRFGL
jgi:hypothetical protein